MLKVQLSQSTIQKGFLLSINMETKGYLNLFFWKSFVWFSIQLSHFANGKKIFELNDLKYAVLYSPCYFFAWTRAVPVIFRLFSIKPRESEVSWFDATVKAMDIT